MLHQKACKFNFRKTSSAGHTKHSWSQQTGQLQLPVFKTDNAIGPTNHLLSSSLWGHQRADHRLQGSNLRPSPPWPHRLPQAWAQEPQPTKKKLSGWRIKYLPLELPGVEYWEVSRNFRGVGTFVTSSRGTGEVSFTRELKGESSSSYLALSPKST